MARWALINGGVVSTVIEQNTQPTIPGQWVNVTGQQVSPGSTYDGVGFGPVRGPLSITLKAFWRRFLVAEREALQNILATGTQNQKNRLNAFRDYLLQGGDVELNDDYIVASVTLMETAGIIAAGRANTILTP